MKTNEKYINSFDYWMRNIIKNKFYFDNEKMQNAYNRVLQKTTLN